MFLSGACQNKENKETVSLGLGKVQFSLVRARMLLYAVSVVCVVVMACAFSAALPATAHEPINPAAEALAFLQKHLPDQDRETDITTADLERTVNLALEAREATAFAKAVPWELFLNDVLPFRALTEPRDDWRPVLRKWNAPLVADAANGSVAVEILNNRSWVFAESSLRCFPFPLPRSLLDLCFHLATTHSASRWDIPSVHSSERIKFVAAPPDELNHYSVFSVLNARNSSCTGLAVFLACSLRSVGIPARVAGVPHWVKGW